MCVLSLCFCPRKRLSAEWRKLRYWSTQSSSCRTPPKETTLELEVEARNTPSKTVSPPAYREPVSSWYLRVKACGLEQRWMHLSLLALPAQTLQTPKGELNPLALWFSRSPPDLSFACWYTGPSTGCILPSVGPIVFRATEVHFAPPQFPNRPTQWRVQWATRTDLSVSLCGDPGPDHQAVTWQTELLKTITCLLIFIQQHVLFIWHFQCNVLNMGLLLSVISDLFVDIVNVLWSHHVLLQPIRTKSC